MKYLAILFMCIAAAVVYGVVHDQVTARVCVEYFTVGHPRIIASTSPTALAFAWGFAATWWVGFFLGAPLGALCRLGPLPKIEPRELLRPLGILLLTMGVVAALAGFLGYRLGLPADDAALWGRVLPPGRLPRFSADAWAHSASYLSGAIGGFVLWVWAVVKRVRAAGMNPPRVAPLKGA